jgi:glutamate 5-kinase
MKGMHKIVIKVGSSTLTQGMQTLSRRYMLSLVQQIAYLKSRGLQLVLVSSGAVATGRECLNFPQIDSSTLPKQAFASIGQVKLMQTWLELFSLLDLQAGQVLLTKDDFSHPKCDLTRDTLNFLLQHLVPIVNENDTIAAHGSRIGDNDNLAALVAHVIAADTVILLTDQEGLYTADPRLNPDARFIPVVKRIDEMIFALAAGSSTSVGTGGMTTKIEAAQTASRAGIRTVIASSNRPNVLIDLVEGKQIGTVFLEENISVEPERTFTALIDQSQAQSSNTFNLGAAEK